MKPRPNKVIVTTDLKLAPKTATQAKQWVNGIKVDEVINKVRQSLIFQEIDDAYQALREIISQSKLDIEIQRIGQAENSKVSLKVKF